MLLSDLCLNGKGCMPVPPFWQLRSVGSLWRPLIRKPMLLFLLSGLFLLRYAQRTFLDSLLKEPPRGPVGISLAVGSLSLLRMRDLWSSRPAVCRSRSSCARHAGIDPLITTSSCRPAANRCGPYPGLHRPAPAVPTAPGPCDDWRSPVARAGRRRHPAERRVKVWR